MPTKEEIDQIAADNFHSVTFQSATESKNSWKDWHLVPMTRPVINPPTQKTSVVDIPGADGVIDLSEVVSGKPVYNNRTGSIEFLVQNGFKEWSDTFSTVMAYLNGSKKKIIFNDDPNYYYEGRVWVSKWDSSSSIHYSKITVDYDVGPYKYSLDGKTKML